MRGFIEMHLKFCYWIMSVQKKLKLKSSALETWHWYVRNKEENNVFGNKLAAWDLFKVGNWCKEHFFFMND